MQPPKTDFRYLFYTPSYMGYKKGPFLNVIKVNKYPKIKSDVHFRRPLPETSII